MEVAGVRLQAEGADDPPNTVGNQQKNNPEQVSRTKQSEPHKTTEHVSVKNQRL